MAERNVVHAVRVEREADRLGMPSVDGKVIGAGVQPLHDVVSGDTPARSLGHPFSDAEEDRGAVVALDEPGGDDAHHPLVPVLAGEDDDRRRWTGALDALDSLLEDLSLHVLARAVQLVKLLGQRGRLLFVFGEQQAQRRRRIGQPAGRVQTGSQAVGDGSRVGGAGAAGYPGESPQTDALPDGDELEALANVVAVLTRQRGQIGDGTDGDQVEQTFELFRQPVGCSPPPPDVKPMQHLERQADAAEGPVRVLARHLVDEMTIGEDGPRLMVIDHHDVQTALPCERDFVRVVDTAVHGDEQTRSTRRDGLDRHSGEAVSFLEPAGQIPIGLESKFAKP